MILHIIPTVTDDFTRDQVMLVPALPEDDVHWIVLTGYTDPCIVDRDVAFAGLTAFRRVYQDFVVHTQPV